MPKYTVESEEVLINTPIELAWEILTDTEHYAEWNPFTPKIETDFQIGSSVHLEVHLGTMTLQETERLEVFEPPNRLAWSTQKVRIGSIACVSAFREQALTRLSEGQCSYKCRDYMNGPLTPFVKLMFDKSLRAGFTSVGIGLKHYAEAKLSEKNPHRD